jgi:hypothetical protein
LEISRYIFPATKCDNVNYAIFSGLKNRKSDKPLGFPEFTINLNEKNISLDYFTLFSDTLDTKCTLDLEVTFFNHSGLYGHLNYDDLFILGKDLFKSFKAVQWDYENKKIAFELFPGQE